MAQRLFAPIVPESRRHPNFEIIRCSQAHEPTRLMMEQVFNSMAGIADTNFVEQFQTTGFDARLFELFLHAYLKSIGAHIGRAEERPDYLVTRCGATIAVEATTANPTQVRGAQPRPITGVDLRALVAEDESERKDRLEHEIPIRIGSALFSKLSKRYWELPHVRDRPLVFAVTSFHAHDALLFSFAGVAQYLYGLRQSGRHDAEGRLVISTDTVADHQLGPKSIPSNFFAQPGAEHVSAVLYTNVASVSKFTRMGYQAGLHRGNVIVTRVGEAWDPDPDASKAVPFVYRMDEDPGEEPWGSGVYVFHNPNALHPVSDEFFGDAVQVRLQDDAPMYYSPRFAPFSSVTHKVHLDFDSLIPVEDRPGGVGTILRAEFDAHDPERPPYESAEVPFSEVAWFADRARCYLGTVLRWHGREEYGLVVLGRDTSGRWRAIDFGSGHGSLDGAARHIVGRIERLLGSG
jgi:hypothetical protein